MYKNKLDTVDVVLDFRVFSHVKEAGRFIHLLVLGPQLNTQKKIHIIFITKQSIPFSFHLNIKVKFIHGLLLAERFVRIKDSSQYHDVASARLWPQFSDKRSPQSAEICLAPRR